MADISQIRMPSGSLYDIKDTVARSAISSGGTFVVAWNGNDSPVAANIPAGVTVSYNNNTITGTLAASINTIKKFYLVRSSSQQNPTLLDIYDEYITLDNGEEANPRYTWEKIGDTQIKLSEIVTNVTLNKQTATVVGTDSTFTVTQPAFTVTPNTTYIEGAASGGAVTADTDDQVTVVTGYDSPTSATFLKNVTANTSKLETTSVLGVNGSTTASKVSAGTSQTTAKGTGTASTSTDAWLKGWSVSGEVLSFSGVTMDTQTTTQINIDSASVTVPVAAANATQVATGGLNANDAHGSSIATGVTTSGTGYTGSALTGLGTPSTDDVLGVNSSFNVTNPTISMSTKSSSGTGRAAVAATSQINATRSTDVGVAWDNKDTQTVLDNTTSITVTKTT